MCANTISASNHNNPLEGSSVTEQDYKRITCVQCKAEFNSKRKKKYCSAICNGAAQRRKAGALPRVEFDTMRRSPANCFVCEHCGADSYRRMSPANIESGYANRFCSMVCRVAHASVKRADSNAETERYRLIVKPEVDALRRIAANIRSRERVQRRAESIAANLIRSCADCDEVFVQRTHLGCPELRCGPCEAIEGRRLHRIAKLRRKAKERGVEVDSIDPIKVFERDKWRCHICKIKTPKELRGTHGDRAPELEHIVSLADGGAHTWGNVACSCRKCNQAKGAASFGQLGLRIAA